MRGKSHWCGRIRSVLQRIAVGSVVATASVVMLAVTDLTASETARADDSKPPEFAVPGAKPVVKIPAAVCLTCHSVPGFSIKGPDGKPRDLSVQADKFHGSVHGSLDCVDCHANITQVPHPPIQIAVDCVTCHENRWVTAQAVPTKSRTPEEARLGDVVQMIGKFMNSIHARPSMADQSRTNATCYNCHQPHYVYPPGTAVWSAWRMSLPAICGKCHQSELAPYSASVHGRLVLDSHDPAAPVCSDCHTNHDIQNPQLTTSRLVITQNCGGCHRHQLDTYLDTYHGQITLLGYGTTAKCFDCHGYHTIQRVDDPRSAVYSANRVNTCRKCHTGATPGFATFAPHGDPSNFQRFPLLWLTSKAMTLLLLGVFTFFWTHCGLWFYRSWKERNEPEPVYVALGFAPEGKRRFYERFPAFWRVAHLLVLLSTMTLVLTGMSLYYSDSFWAPLVIRALGGPLGEAIIHRIAATIFVTVFFLHVVVMFVRLVRKPDFRWFGPDSLVPRWQDFRDIASMYRWFLGLGPRPALDRWTYWEKFDYWAVFWGIGIIGLSGAILWAKTLVADILPGYAFNIATILHGDEANLAAVFLFTVHFFNNHFRPGKFPLDTTMFTGLVSLEELRREHAEQYERLVSTGELQSRLVEGQSPLFNRGSRILGFTLLGIGLLLLVLVTTGFVSSAVNGSLIWLKGWW